MATLPHNPDRGDFETAATSRDSTSTKAPKKAPRVRRDRVSSHESFLTYASGRWAKVAIGIFVVGLVASTRLASSRPFIIGSTALASSSPVST